MADWRPYREPLRVTLTRTLSIAIVAGAVVASRSGGIRRWPLLSLLMLWPAFGGHWIDMAFLNWLRPRLPESRPIQVVARVALWFVGGMVLALGVRLTAMLFVKDQSLPWLTWATAGTVFVAIELVAHAALHLRGRPSFYNGLG
jgi:fatty acid desaturase